jgi:hypothetical protein
MKVAPTSRGCRVSALVVSDMNERNKMFLAAAFVLAGCATDADELDTGTASDPLSLAISVQVGDPIAMVAAPYVIVDALVGDVLDLTAVAPTCPTTCSLTWRDPDRGIARYGGVILGYGPTLSITESVAGSSRVTLDYCQKTSGRFSRCIKTMVYVTTH